MITLSPECYPCFFRQADTAARAGGASESDRREIAGRVAGILAGRTGPEIPAGIATDLHEAVREALGSDDPFREVKEREFRRFQEIARLAESIVASCADPVAAAVGMAVFGNIMDSGIVDPEAMEEEIRRLRGEDGFREIPDGLREGIRRARTVGILLDNAGEAAFDVPLLSRLGREERRLWIGVKGGPVIDDLTGEEAVRIGLSAYGEIVPNGNRAVGTDLALCTREFRERLGRSDLILSKGQANFETLHGRLRNAFFLFRCKCPVVSRALGRPEGDLVVLGEDGA
ncbi:MAG TPA: ARMT1-like domain-containing protein [Candidatus Aquicultoraceae bacterium]|nr:ARMT1-like domain-containing protein [Candidatus Aquicultoraceae bacterium]